METLSYTTTIILGAIWLIIAEIVWLLIVHDWEDMKEWGGYKIMSLFIAGMITFLIYGGYILLRDYPEYSLIGLVGILFAYLYFRTNYDIGKAMVKRNNSKKKKKKK